MLRQLEQNRANRTAPPRLRRSKGFTLIESALVTVIISTGVMAMLTLMAAGTSTTADGQNMVQAMQLLNSIREMTVSLPGSDPTSPTTWGPETGETFATYDDVDDFDGFNSDALGGPIDARRQVIADMDAWSQQIIVETVDPDALKVTIPDGSENTNRITVVIRRDGRELARASWLVTSN